MFEFMQEEERGQVGIGTLIVFIAMVLVAAIAAGVLINTAGFLQSQSEATGQESTQQVTDRLQVVNVVGSDTGSTSQLDSLEFTVTKSPGSGDIDLTEATVEIIGPQGSDTRTIATGDISDIGSNTGDVLTDDNDRLKITLSTSGNAIASDGLAAGQSATVRITTASGGTTTVELRAPDNLESGDTVLL
ncbi:MAG: archaellin/type IV pilin N-terminal domain-containing protein [Haloferacaceae archaeon]